VSRLGEVMLTYQGSDSERTRLLYDELAGLGPLGVIAMNLLRAQKASSRAKDYRGRGYRGQAYDKKQWSMDNACRALIEHGAEIGWGWGLDPAQPVHCHVLYVETPFGQVSFHSGQRGDGPDYLGAWDGVQGMGADRITRWCARLLDEAASA
jgi:hypothetical protein